MTKLNKKNKFFKNQKYICFYDSEFNAYDNFKDTKYPQELVSIGICIVDIYNNIIDKYYSLIKLKLAKKISKRCMDITGIKNSDMKNALDFITVFNNLSSILKKYKIEKIYCYGLEDKKAFLRTSLLYMNNKKIMPVVNKFYDIRTVFLNDSNGKVGNQGLNFLKKICNIDGEVLHNALFDAIDLSQVFNTFYTIGYDKNKFEQLTKEREELSEYKKARKLKDNQGIFANEDILKAKNKIINYLNKTNIPNLHIGTKKAIIDDLNILLENKETSK